MKNTFQFKATFLKFFKSYQNNVAIRSPLPMQSTKITYSKKYINSMNDNRKARANPIDVTKIQKEVGTVICIIKMPLTA